MKVFMLGWEFPPMVSGGLGVACYGLAKALNGLATDVLFVLPKPRGATSKPQNFNPPRSSQRASNGHATHQLKSVQAPSTAEVHQAVEQASAEAAAVQAADHAAELIAQQSQTEHASSYSPEHDFIEEGHELPEDPAATGHFPRVTFVPIDAWLQPYMTATQYLQMVVEEIAHPSQATAARWVGRALSGGANGPVPQPPNRPASSVPASAYLAAIPAPPPIAPGGHQRTYIDEPARHEIMHGPANTTYAGDLFSETERYARLALAVARGEQFSVIHAHDWMTFEAAMAVASASGKPLVVQIHSTELDRAGAQANARIMEVERQGMNAADAVIAVSYRTKTQLIEKYGIDPRKIEVVYNATEASRDDEPHHHTPAIAKSSKKTVLFLGRLAKQKGPAYFLHAAKKVLSINSNVEFVLAGKGELADDLKQLSKELNIRSHVVFAGFVKKRSAERMLKSADVYVMPSVSEPFGIAPLEALAQEVPVIISKQSGVAEVLQHVLKVDFWDTDDLANKILAVLRHPPLAATLREQGQREVRQLSWEDSAERIIELYNKLTAAEQPKNPTPVDTKK